MSEFFDTRLREWREQIDARLEKVVSATLYPSELKEILLYSMFPGGKRLRPVLFLECHGLFAPPDDNALLYACGIEMLHTFSLIHDDMPCIDNDDYRRGKLSVHKKYGEGKALLAGDALMDLAYSCMLTASSAAGAVRPLSLFSVSGDSGIIHGQYLDLYSDIDSVDKLLNVYSKKTGSLIKGSCLSGFTFRQELSDADYLAEFCSDIEPSPEDDDSTKRIRYVGRFGEAFGVAFQLYDDISEYIAGEESDGASILDFIDLDKAKAMLNTYLDRAVGALERSGGDTSFLKELVDKFVIM